MKSRKSYCTTPGVDVGIGVGGVGVSITKKFNIQVFYVMGMALSGELSCPLWQVLFKFCSLNFNACFLGVRMVKQYRYFISSSEGSSFP